MMILNYMKYTEEIRESESENGSQIPKWPNFPGAKFFQIFGF